MRNVIGWAVMGVLVCGSAVLGQETRPGVPNVRPGVRPVPGAQNPAGQVPNQAQVQYQNADQQIAAIIAACNRNEVEISKFALTKLQSAEAKEIATMLIKDHTEGANKFSKFAGQSVTEQLRATNPPSGLTRGDAPPATRVDPATTPRVALKPATGGSLDLVSLHQEMADEGLASCKKELSKYEGNEFDKAFLGHQIGGHLMASANLRVLKRHASSELAAEIDSALETTESHLKKVRDLMDEKKEEKSDNK